MRRYNKKIERQRQRIEFKENLVKDIEITEISSDTDEEDSTRELSNIEQEVMNYRELKEGIKVSEEKLIEIIINKNDTQKKHHMHLISTMTEEDMQEIGPCLDIV